jgi:hypothetical protein
LIPITSYQRLCDFLTQDFDYWRHSKPNLQNLKVRLCAILFARPHTDLASREIFPEIEYFNERLGPRLHVFVAGCFGGIRGEFPDERPVGRTGDWQYSDVAFNQLRKDLESRSSWHYKDGCELLLLNTTFDSKKQQATIDFGSAVRADLVKARDVGAIQSVAELIGRMSDYCEHSENQNDPAWGFSDSMGGEVIRSSLWHLLVSLLPERLRNDADAARIFVLDDLKKA